MKTYDWYWVLWIAGLFLVPEILAAFDVIPLDTFSRTTQLAEVGRPWLKAIVFGFGIGLVAHLIVGTPFWKAEIGGMLAALALWVML